MPLLTPIGLRPSFSSTHGRQGRIAVPLATKGEQNQAIGLGGRTTEIHTRRWVLPAGRHSPEGGQVADCTAGPMLIEQMLAAPDKVYDGNANREQVRGRGTQYPAQS